MFLVNIDFTHHAGVKGTHYKYK